MGDEPLLLPLRMLNEWTYCPRLFYLEFVDGLWEESVDTVAGAVEHAATDTPPVRRSRQARRGAPAQAPEPFEGHTLHVALSDPGLGITGRLDVLEHDDGVHYPLEYKHGSPPQIGRASPERIGPSGGWLTDEIQVCAQGLLLEANGWASPRGRLFYRETQEQVVVDFTDDLRRRTVQVIAAARALTLPVARIPPPLIEDPRCVRCSLAPVCLPEETHHLAALDEAPQGVAEGEERPSEAATLRRIIPAADERGVMWVNTQGATLGRSGGVLVVRTRDGVVGETPMGQVRQLSVFGNVQITTQAVQSLLREGIPVAYFSMGGAFYGLAHGLPTKNVEWRRQQYLRFHHPETCLALARAVVVGKLRNQRTMLRRNHRRVPADAVDALRDLADAAETAPTLDALLGLEGSGARLYYEHFPGMLKAQGEGFSFTERNRRPPRDPVNALLSLAYAVLAKDLTVAVYATGLDPMFGFYHQPRFGRPALALDLMEEFRPLVADSVVLSLLNNGVLGPDDFIRSTLGCNLTDHARSLFFQAYEHRKQQLVTHPLFGYRLSYGRLPELQARLLGRVLTGEISRYHPMVTR